MAYEHAGYIELTDPEERAVELRRYIAEVTRDITANVTKGASSRDVSPLVNLRSELRKELAELEGRLDQRGGFHYARLSKH